MTDPNSVSPTVLKYGRFPVLTDDMIENFPDPEWLVEGILPAKSLSLLYGPPAGGKTFVALDLSYSVATASPWLGRATTPGAVLYVLAEGVSGLGQRVRAWKSFHNVSGVQRVYFVAKAVQLHNVDVDSFLFEALAQIKEPLALVVFDTVARCFVGGEENSAKDIGMLVDGAERVRRRCGAAVMLVHHTTKAGEAERGSSALRGAVDTMLELSPGNDTFVLSCEKQKDAQPFQPVRLHLASVAGSCVVEGVEEGATGKALDILRILEEADPLGLTASDWLDQSGLPQTTFYRNQKTLKKRGDVREDAGLYTVTEQGRGLLVTPIATKALP